MFSTDLQMAWRNVIRHKRRSLTAIIIIALGYYTLAGMSGFALFTYSSLAKFSADATGHITVAHPDYFDKSEDTPMQYGIGNWQDDYKSMLTDRRVRKIIPRVKFSGLVSNGEKSEIFLGDGTTIAGMRAQAMVIQLEDGRMFAKKSDDMEIVVGNKLLESLKLNLGDMVTMMATDVEGVLNAMDAVIVGVVDTGVPELNKRYVSTHYKFAQDLLVTDKISYLSVMLKDASYTTATLVDFAEKYSQYKLTPWEDLAFFYKGVKNLYNNLFSTMAFLVILVVFASINNVISMSVLERIREIGTMRAMGVYPSGVVKNFITEGIIMGGLGSLLGIGLTFLTYVGLTFAKIQMAPPPGRTKPYPLYIELDATIMSIIVAMCMGVCLIASYMSSRAGAKKEIVEALSDV